MVSPPNERARYLLKRLIQRYIADGEPVGSRTLAKDANMDLSPATVRNVMADLEECGLISSPHASAGRIPTVQGYRFFVDQLIKVKKLSQGELARLTGGIDPLDSPEHILSLATSQLSDVTAMAGVVLVPRRERNILRQIEFLPLAKCQILVILVTNESNVQNRVITMPRVYSPSELEQAANYINRHYMGQALETVRVDILKTLESAREGLDIGMRATIAMAQQALTEEGRQEHDYLLAGQTNLMNYREMGDLDKLRQLFDAFTTKHDILHLLNHSLQAQGVQLFIGEESGYQVLEGCSVVTSPYEVDGEMVGVVGVIGPTRMAYDRVIPIVDVTAQVLGAALNQHH